MAAKKQVEIIQVMTTDDPKVFKVPSRSRKGIDYVVVDRGEEGLLCNCEAAHRGRYCAHVDAVIRNLTFKGKEQEADLIRLLKTSSPRERPVTKNGYPLDETISAMHKEVRLGNEEMAVFWALESSTIAPGYTWKRVVIQVSEDVGIADPEAVRTVIALAGGWEFCKWLSRWFVDPEALVHAVIVMCRAKKSSEVDDLKTLVQLRVKNGWRPEVPEYAVDVHTARGKKMGKKDWKDWYEFRKQWLGGKGGEYMEILRKEFPDYVGDTPEEGRLL